jgi:hypothetical protein
MMSAAVTPWVRAVAIRLPRLVREEGREPGHGAVLLAGQAADEVGFGHDALHPRLASTTGTAEMPRSASSRAMAMKGFPAEP